MMQLLPRDMKVDFIGKWKIAFLFSFLLIAFSFYVWFNTGDDKYGTDFKGGHDLLVKVAEEVNSETIRNALTVAGFGDASVQAFKEFSSKGNEFSIRLGGTGDASQVKQVKEQVQAVLTKISPSQAEILKTDFVGPTVGKELRQRALLATGLGIVFLLIYITIRFEFAFALGAVVAVFHDVIVATGFYVYFGYPINMGAVAAALTILGYSVNDTIVIFDRVREELRNPKYKDLDLSSLINMCINETMSRTVITSLLTLLSVVALLVFGGGSIQDLSFFLFVGMISGIYSTVYIAAPVVIGWEMWRRRKEVLEPARVR